MQEIQIFENPELGEVRTVIINGEPWFVGKDVADILGYKDTVNALKQHVDFEDKIMGCQNTTPSVIDSKGRVQYPTFVNESGLYSLIFGSKLETAKKFKHWVTSEVLPSIRETGSYGKQIATQEIPIGEVASYLKAMDRVAVRQNLAPHKIAENFKKVSEQFGIQLTDDFIKIPDYIQQTLPCVTNR